MLRMRRIVAVPHTQALAVDGGVCGLRVCASCKCFDAKEVCVTVVLYKKTKGMSARPRQSAPSL